MNDVVEKMPEPPTVGLDPMTAMIERVLGDTDIPMERVTALIDIRERQLNKEAEQAFNASFAAAMAEMPDVKRSGMNDHTKKKYSTLDDLIRASRPTLAKHGLSLNWQTGIDGDKISVKANVRHSLGHSIETTLHESRDKSGAMNVIQGGGSTQTYLKRYTGFAILGLSSGDEVDDDAQSAALRLTVKDQSWEKTAVQDLPEHASPREKAQTIADALCAQWKRKSTLRQLNNEWDRRVHLIEGDAALQGKHSDLYDQVVDGWEIQSNNLKEDQ